MKEIEAQNRIKVRRNKAMEGLENVTIGNL